MNETRIRTIGAWLALVGLILIGVAIARVSTTAAIAYAGLAAFWIGISALRGGATTWKG